MVSLCALSGAAGDGGSLTYPGVTVAAGAVVRGSIPPNVVVAGNPARIIKHLKGPQVLA